MRQQIQTNRNFSRSIIEEDHLLDSAISWIQDNLTPEDVFELADLVRWALDKGFKLENP